MKYILVSTDYSTVARQALSYAAMLAQKTGAKLGVFHAYHIPILLAGRTDLSQDVIEREAEEFHHKEEAIFRDEWNRAGLVLPEMEWFTLEGFAADMIAQVAEDKNAGLIVMGTHGASGVREVLLGSITVAVMDRTRIPMLVVPDGYQFDGIRKITFATDWKTDEQECVRFLVNLARKFGAHLDVVSVMPTDKPLEESALLTSSLEAVDYPNTSLRYITGDSVSSALNKYIEEEKPSLFAVVRRHRTFFSQLFHPSLSRKMAMHTHAPMMVFCE